MTECFQSWARGQVSIHGNTNFCLGSTPQHTHTSAEGM